MCMKDQLLGIFGSAVRTVFSSYFIYLHQHDIKYVYLLCACEYIDLLYCVFLLSALDLFPWFAEKRFVVTSGFCSLFRTQHSRLSAESGSTPTREASGVSSRTTFSSCGSTSSATDIGDRRLMKYFRVVKCKDCCFARRMSDCHVITKL